jgi:hypothetical protein
MVFEFDNWLQQLPMYFVATINHMAWEWKAFETTLLIDYQIVVMNGQKYSMTFDQIGFPSDNIWRVNTGGRC